MDLNNTAKSILKYVGKTDNIKDVTRCITRIRLALHDFTLVNKEEILKLEGVITVVNSMDQLQIVLGNKVEEVYNELEQIISTNSKDNLNDREAKSNHKYSKGNIINNVLANISKIFTPTIAVLAGSGMIKGILAVVAMYYLKSHNVDIKTNENYIIFNAASDAVFYFFPIILGYTSAKVFKSSELIAMVLGAALCYPTIIALMADEKAINLIGINITKANYTSSVIPIIIAVWVLSKLESLLKKIIPNVIKIIMVPALSILIMVPATLIVFGPAGIYIGNIVNGFYQYLMNISPILCGAFIGGMWCVLVIFGAHRPILPIAINDIAQNGRQNLLAFAGAANFSQAGAAMGVFLKTKNKTLKTVSLSASITALFGITEPAIYGANLRLKTPMICAVICGAIGGGIMGYGGSFGIAFANQGLLTIPVYAEAGFKGFTCYLLGCTIAFLGSAISTYIIGFKDIEDNNN